MFDIELDVNENDSQSFDKNLTVYLRRLEAILLVLFELMRLTDYMNSLPVQKTATHMTHLRSMKPSEELLRDLWNLAKDRMRFEDFHHK